MISAEATGKKPSVYSDKFTWQNGRSTSPKEEAEGMRATLADTALSNLKATKAFQEVFHNSFTWEPQTSWVLKLSRFLISVGESLGEFIEGGGVVIMRFLEVKRVLTGEVVV